jgi:hypothetical protein
MTKDGAPSNKLTHVTDNIGVSGGWKVYMIVMVSKPITHISNEV